MSGFDPEFDAAGAGTRSGIVPAPGAIDGRANYLRADKTWAVPGSAAPGPEPPAPGPALDQWACNIAGYLTYEVSRLAVKYVVDWLPVSWLGDVAGGIVAGIAGALLPATLLVDGILEAAIFDWVSTYVSGHVVDIGTALLDDVAWAKIHCALYDKIKLTPTNLHTAILALTAALGGLVGWTSPAIAAVGYLFEHLGITDVSGIPVSAFVKQYDCSSCAMTGIGPVKPVLQTSFDLVVTDGTTKVPFTDTVAFTHARVAASGETATVTPVFGVQHNGTTVGDEPNIDLVDAATLNWTVADDAGDGTVIVSGTVPVATSGSPGVARPDGQTIGVSSGIYSVIAGSLASVTLDQYGTADSHVAGGATISGLTVGNTYAVQSTGGPWNPSYPGPYTAYSWQMSNDGGTSWDNVYADDTINPTSPTVFVPTWAVTAERTDAHHARVVFVATATSIRFRAAGTSPATANGTLGWQLLDVSYEPGAVRFDHNGSKVATRPRLNFQDSTGITWSLADNGAGDGVDLSLSVASTGVAAVAASAPITASTVSGTATVGLTTPLGKQYGGTGLDTSGVGEGDLLVGQAGGTWVRGGLGAGSGVTVTELGGIFTISASGTGGGGTGLTLLATVTVGPSSVASVAFASVPGSYTHLLILWMIRATGANTFQFLQTTFNGDSGAHYTDSQWEVGTNSPAANATFAAGGYVTGGSCSAGAASAGQLWLPFYAQTTFWKTFIQTAYEGDGLQRGGVMTGNWKSTAAISSITFALNVNNLEIGSCFSLYALS